MYQTYVFPQLNSFSEFFFTETEDECILIDTVYKTFFSNLRFSFAGLKSFPHAPSAVLKKMSRIRFYRLVHGLVGCDTYDLFNFVGGVENPRLRLQYPSVKNKEVRDEAIRKNPVWRLITWYNCELPSRYKGLKGNNYNKFLEWVNEESYVLHKLHSKDAYKLRQDLINGRFANVWQRKQGYIREGQKRKAEKMENLLNDTLKSLSPFKSDYHNPRYVKSRYLNIGGASVAAADIGGAGIDQLQQNTTTRHAVELSPKSPPHSPTIKTINGVLVKVGLDRFEDPTVGIDDPEPSAVDHVEENHETTSNDKIQRNNCEVPGRRRRKRKIFGGGRVQEDHEISITDLLLE